MKNQKTNSRKKLIESIAVRPSELNMQQPLGRFLITLFRQFEDQLLFELRKKYHRKINASDFNVLRFIDPKGNSINEIASLAGVSKQAISKQVAALEKTGFVIRESDSKDLRSIKVRFTKAGQKLISDSIQIIGQIEASYTDQIGSNQFDNLKLQLSRLIKTET